MFWILCLYVRARYRILCFPPRWQDMVLLLFVSWMARCRLSPTCLGKGEITNSRICPLKDEKSGLSLISYVSFRTSKRTHTLPIIKTNHMNVLWLKHCATSRKVAGSIPDGVIGIFHWHNPSGRTMILGLTQPLNRN